MKNFNYILVDKINNTIDEFDYKNLLDYLYNIINNDDNVVLFEDDVNITLLNIDEIYYLINFDKDIIIKRIK